MQIVEQSGQRLSAMDLRHVQVQFSGLRLDNHFGVTSDEFNLSAKNKQAGISFKTLWHMDLAQNQARALSTPVAPADLLILSYMHSRRLHPSPCNAGCSFSMEKQANRHIISRSTVSTEKLVPACLHKTESA